MNKMDQRRIHVIKKTAGETSGPVVYWMSRDQRTRDNWALLHAQELALERKAPLVVLFCLVPEFLHAAIRHYGFMLQGLSETEAELHKKNISFFLLTGSPGQKIPGLIKKLKASVLVADFDPLKVKLRWKDEASQYITASFFEVDAHNIVPCRVASLKQEYGAYTLRPKINRLLPEFLDDFPLLKKHPFTLSAPAKKIDWELVLRSLPVNRKVREVSWLTPGENASQNALRTFLSSRLKNYSVERNDPTLDGQSNLSPYLHFGQLSAQRVALEVTRRAGKTEAAEALLEELVVRRELSDNFCFYNPRYDSTEGFPEWARKSLYAHRRDRREYTYSFNQFENAATHDDLWNAAQIEMVERGKMHGYMRMYWAKKILEWAETPEDALEIALYLNDKYELDGRDPNGYTGIAWSIGGVHDRAWGERPVFGKIRYMSYNGCKSKFNVKAYIEKYK
jgi:deoxyribodipyrimidine photo-lyase